MDDRIGPRPVLVAGSVLVLVLLATVAGGVAAADDPTAVNATDDSTAANATDRWSAVGHDGPGAAAHAAQADSDVDEGTGCTDGICGERVEDPAADHRAGVVWISWDPDVETGASGVLVEPDVVLTAAHVIRDTEENRPAPAEQVSVVPGRDGSETPVGEVGVEAIYPDERWSFEPFADPEYGEDLAILRLEEPIGTETGTFDYANPADLTDDGRLEDVRVAGYPDVSFWSGRDVPERTMWIDEGSVEVVDPEGAPPFLHAGAVGEDDGLEAYFGHSGGPIYATVDGEPTVIGLVHGPYEGDDRITVGPTITDRRADRIAEVSEYAPDERSDLLVDLEAGEEPIPADADEVDVAFTATNPLRTELADEVEVTVDGTVVDTVPVDLGPNETRTLTRSVAVDPDPGEDLAVGVEATDDADSATLAVDEPAGDGRNGADADADADDGGTGDGGRSDGDRSDTDGSADDGFDDGQSEADDDVVPGFGVAMGLVGLLGGGALVLRWRCSTIGGE